MQRRDERRVELREQRERHVVEVKVQHVEFMRTLTHAFEQQHVRREGVADRRIEAQRARPCGFERRTGFGVAACEQRHIVAEVHERIGEVGHHALGAAVEFRGDCFVQRCNLCDSHNVTLLFMRASHNHAPVERFSECLSDGQRFAAARDRPGYRPGYPLRSLSVSRPVFRVIFQSLNLVTGRNTGCYEALNPREKPIRWGLPDSFRQWNCTRASQGFSTFRATPRQAAFARRTVESASAKFPFSNWDRCR